MGPLPEAVGNVIASKTSVINLCLWLRVFCSAAISSSNVVNLTDNVDFMGSPRETAEVPVSVNYLAAKWYEKFDS